MQTTQLMTKGRMRLQACLVIMISALLASPLASAQTTAKPAPVDPVTTTNVQSGTEPRRQLPPAPRQSPAQPTPAPLQTTGTVHPLAADVAGTCTVIDALVAEQCAQNPQAAGCAWQ